MNPILSPLLLKDFAITNCEYRFSAISDEFESIEDLFNEYSIDIDFGYGKNEDLTSVFVKVSINYKEDEADEAVELMPGYSISVEGISIFSFSKESALNEKEKNNLLNFSALSITINHIRGFIATLTAYSPVGKYSLPAIDVNNLLAQRIERSKADKVKE